MRLLLDEMLPAVIAEQLRSRGHDVIGVVEQSELRGLPDADLFDHAQRQQRAIVTYNRDDYLALDRQSRSQERDHHGIVILHPRRFSQIPATVGTLIRSLETLLTAETLYPGFVHWLQGGRP